MLIRRQRRHAVERRTAYAREPNGNDGDARLLQNIRRVDRSRWLVLAVLLTIS
jgi:hypothetical protein